MLLAIDTSTRYAGVALVSDEGQTLQLLCWRSQQNHTVELMPSVELALARQRVTLKGLSGIAVAIGPGSFSALRVGLSVAKGLAWTAGLPLASATTLEVEAYPYRWTGMPVCAVLDAGRGEVSWALYELGGGGLRLVQPEGITEPSQLGALIPDDALVCGEGLERFSRELQSGLGPACRLALPYHPGQRLAALAHLGWLRLRAGQRVDPAALQPLYLRRPTITEPGRPTSARG
ncbi:MAG: tRNA (adenosine(37)-N6)-threonylcarbamoyltransferase complex dimerization subunit type 1 TsaB [Chloroflexi bacterium]|nr:tRNA (adenosine(37)-N6)-threonylcarbamoyltransferase complex dimerization subunit type 1 TsaB [Chloroflexota bacterium]